MVLTAYLTTSFVGGGVRAFRLLRDQKNGSAALMVSMAMGLAGTALASPSHAQGARRETGSERVAPVPEWEHRRDFRPTTGDWWTRRETRQKHCYWTGPGPRGTYRCT
jgi:hypothetical protein